MAFTQLPNQILEALIVNGEITRTEFQVLLAIARFSFGFQMEGVPLSVSWFEKVTELKRRTVTRSLISLTQKGVIGKAGMERMIDSGQRVTIWKINSPNTWKVGTPRSPQVGTLVTKR